MKPHYLLPSILLSCGYLLSFSAYAIVMRHDRDEQRYMELARDFPATATLWQNATPDAFCGEGTLIDPYWVLTAGHVAAELESGGLAKIAGQSHHVLKVFLHPQYRLTKTSLTADIALVQLVEPVHGTTPAKIYADSDEIGMLVTFVGIGDYGTGLTGPVSWGGANRAATNRVESADGDTIQFRFDAPGDPHVTELEGISGPGDSGGPAYFTGDGVLYTIGVSSWQDQTAAKIGKGRYGVIENYARVSAYVEWIRQTLAAQTAQ